MIELVEEINVGSVAGAYVFAQGPASGVGLSDSSESDLYSLNTSDTVTLEHDFVNDGPQPTALYKVDNRLYFVANADEIGVGPEWHSIDSSGTLSVGK